MKIGIISSLLFLICITGLIAGASAVYCPLDGTDTTQTLNECEGCSVHTNILTKGYSTGLLLYNSDYGLETVNGTTVKTTDVMGRNIALYSKVNVTHEDVLSTLKVMSKMSDVIISDQGYITGCAYNRPCCSGNETYCDTLSSGISATMKSGTFTSKMDLVPIDPSGSISHSMYAKGSGSVLATTGISSLSGINQTVLEQATGGDKVYMIGDNFMMKRIVYLESLR